MTLPHPPTRCVPDSDGELPAGVADDPFFQREDNPFDDPFFQVGVRRQWGQQEAADSTGNLVPGCSVRDGGGGHPAKPGILHRRSRWCATPLLFPPNCLPFLQDNPDADAAEAADAGAGKKGGGKGNKGQDEKPGRKGKKGKGRDSAEAEVDAGKQAELEMLLMDDAALLAAARGGGAGDLAPAGGKQSAEAAGEGGRKLSRKERIRQKKEAKRRERQEGSDDEDAAGGRGLRMPRDHLPGGGVHASRVQPHCPDVCNAPAVHPYSVPLFTPAAACPRPALCW